MFNVPGYISKIDFIRPIGLNSTQYSNFIKRRDYIISLNKKAYLQQLEYSKRYQKLERINERVLFYKNSAFITLTINDDYIQKDFSSLIRIIRYEFKKYFIEYFVLCEDYGKQSNRLHFHGFIDFNKSDSFIYKGFKKGKVRYTLQLNCGKLLVDLFNDITCAYSYALKYCLKDDLKICPRVVYSKSMPFVDKCKNFFEIDNIIID